MIYYAVQIDFRHSTGASLPLHIIYNISSNLPFISIAPSLILAKDPKHHEVAFSLLDRYDLRGGGETQQTNNKETEMLAYKNKQNYDTP
jgi:hypothetical protein